MDIDIASSGWMWRAYRQTIERRKRYSSISGGQQRKAWRDQYSSQRRQQPKAKTGVTTIGERAKWTLANYLKAKT